MTSARPQGQHRQVQQHALRARWKRMQAKVFNMAMPEVLHRLVKEHAASVAQEVGGKANMNKVIVTALYERFAASMSQEQRDECAAFIAQL